MIICPNFSNPEVAREFEELKNATSEAAAYHIWSLNNGNAIDRAPNGAPSKLFLTLLEYYEGDRTKAIQTKAKVYGNSFLNWFGDWTGNATYEVYQGRTSEQPDGRRYNYWSRYENDAKTYGPNVRKVRINPSGFLFKRELRWRTNLNGERVFDWGWSEEYERVIEEFKAQTGYDYFDILENGEEGLKKQNKFFEFLESKGYKGYAEFNEFELQGEEHDNPYTVTFGDNGVIDSDVSKVVDENGEPLVVYRGVNDANSNRLFAYFSNSRVDAEVYAKGLFTKGGNFYANNKDMIFAVNKLLAEKYNLPYLDLDYVDTILYDYAHEGEEYEVDDYEEYEEENEFLPFTETKKRLIGTHKEKYKSRFSKEEVQAAEKTVELIENNKEVKELLEIIRLIDNTTITSENDLTRQYDDSSYLEDIKRLHVLIDKYSKYLNKYKKEYKYNIQAVFLNIKNPYINEIHSEDLLDNHKAYRNGHDGAFLLDGEHFVVKQGTQIKSATDNQGTTPWEGAYSRENDNIYDSTTPFPAVVEPSLRQQLEFKKADLKGEIRKLLDKINTLERNFIRKIPGKNMIISTPYGNLASTYGFIDNNAPSIFGQVSARFKMNKNNVESSLLFPSKWMFTPDNNYTRLENSLRSNQPLISYNLLEYLKLQGFNRVYSVWSLEYKVLDTEVPDVDLGVLGLGSFLAMSKKYASDEMIEEFDQLYGDGAGLLLSIEKRPDPNDEEATQFRVSANINELLNKIKQNNPEVKVSNDYIELIKSTQDTSHERSEEDKQMARSEIEKLVEQQREYAKQIDEIEGQIREEQNREFKEMREYIKSLGEDLEKSCILPF